ncbi:kinesin-like protein [Conoideocrella luteorostrata]|uniref:Kinesin-like protein n=1 Tax=Conoideocrella luteorostrata TaxID=1105319 RepID=A0AAJ0CK85_9HYPO|nr:kinesin-like protein [Conoideocrella luteorostrata]
MPSNLPSSFASAAAGQNANRDSRGGRGDGRGATGGDWSRRDGRSANGTLTLRRSSTTPIGQPLHSAPSIDNAVQHPAAVEATSAQPSSYDYGAIRYSKEDLLGVFRSQNAGDDPSRLFISGWDPSQVNGGSVRGWGKANDTCVPQEPGACWDQQGDTTPIGLHGLSADEKEAFTTEINSPLKPPTQSKEGHQGNVNGRKTSVSQGSGNGFGVISPSSVTRPGTRRRETLESNPFSGGLTSPTTTGRFSREDSSPWTQRRGNDLRESEPDDADADADTSVQEVPSKVPFGNLIRSNTAGSTSMSSMWPPSNPPTPGGGSSGFGNFAMPSTPTVGEKRVGSGAPSGSGSRLAHLIPKDVIDNSGTGQNASSQQSWRTRPRTDTDPFGEDELSGSAVLGGAQDSSSKGQLHATRVGILGTPVKGSASEFGMSGLNIGVQSGDIGPTSPAETNPYRSPHAERHENDEPEAGTGDASLIMGHSEPPANFGSISRGFGAPVFEGSDRSQTSSVGAKAYPLGGLSGWPAPTVPSTGTPDRDRPNFGNAFGSSLFSPMGDLQSPGLSNLGNVFGPSSASIGTGSIGRGSKLGSLFPPAMQAQMQGHDHEQGMSDPLQGHQLGAIGRGNLPGPARETSSPMRSSRGVFEELFPSSEVGRSHTAFSASEGHQQGSSGGPLSFTPVTGGLPFSGGQGGGAELPGQVRQMVMPDRMRWVYLDPQGQVQGPFTGLEMNDWYKANFFTPDLRVKKVEDPEFEPLGQLIRRIGNSREPFLVPQIGIPHGPAPQGGPFNPSTGGGVVPPLSGVFPSFGRTLTADEQNNLERRKQEEQYMMAQQREYMLRQQTMPKFPMPGPGLQHHSSAQSLQSQPSFGSMTSPIGAPPQQQPVGAVAAQPGAFTETQASGRGSAGNGEQFRPNEISGLSAVERDILASFHGEAIDKQQQATEAGFRSDLPSTEQLPEDREGFRDRLKEFEKYREEHEANQSTEMPGDDEAEPIMAGVGGSAVQRPNKTGRSKKRASEDITLSLTQQVQKAQAAAATMYPVEPDMPMPFPPPSSGTPLPAPTAQRARSNLPEQYSRSQTGTPEAAQPPPLAPWAKDPGAEGQKGPSLKEIQEAEARKAAKAEEAAAATRKAVMEQEAAVMREKEKQAAAAAAAGLPATSTWGHGSPASAASPWIRPGPTKGTPSGPVSTSPASSKKTLAEIQREEEFRKQKAKDVATHSGASVAVSKSYANLASKPNSVLTAGGSQPVAPPGVGWATVGAGGKVKVPTTPASQGQRSLSSNNIKAPIGAPARPVSKPASASIIPVSKPDTGNVAMDEFNKWTQRELSRGITSDISSFQATLDVLPLDTSIIADAVYASSTTMDGRHFAAEYVRRKKLAEKGIAEKQPSADTSKTAAAGGGWSEVAKRSGSTQSKESESGSIQGSGFKVVPSRKKGKK